MKGVSHNQAKTLMTVFLKIFVPIQLRLMRKIDSYASYIIKLIELLWIAEQVGMKINR